MPHEDIALLLPNARQAPRPCFLADKKSRPGPESPDRGGGTLRMRA